MKAACCMHVRFLFEFGERAAAGRSTKLRHVVPASGVPREVARSGCMCSHIIRCYLLSSGACIVLALYTLRKKKFNYVNFTYIRWLGKWEWCSLVPRLTMTESVNLLQLFILKAINTYVMVGLGRRLGVVGLKRTSFVLINISHAYLLSQM